MEITKLNILAICQQLGFRCGCKPSNETRVEPFLKSGQATNYNQATPAVVAGRQAVKKLL